MNIESIKSEYFKPYGKALEGYDWSELLETLKSNSEKPLDRTIYVPSCNVLEKCKIFWKISKNIYGGMPIQIGYCNGSNASLNALEYHRGSELNIAADDVVLLLSKLSKVKGGRIDSSEVEAFLLPAGSGVLIYETTLHYAPCASNEGNGFRVAIVLPKGTNLEKPEIEIISEEDRLLWAANKWLIAHPESSEAANGAFAGIIGPNIQVP
ncbi:MAG: DUF4867 family protein [Clostridiales bacterium]|nr:DUF4867 family protein [Clostridiales bacterium]